jgi:hypothetical protein
VSCPDGATLAAYLAGDLPPLERHGAEIHLVRCRACRARVLDLRGAAAEARGDTRPGEESASARGAGFALGLGLALAVVSTLLLAAGRLAEGRGLPGLHLSGAYGMVFALVFWVRDRAPGLLELLGALAAMASVAAIAALAVSSLARRLGPPLAVAALLAGVAAGPARAFETRTAEGAVVVGPREVVAGSLAASSHEVRVEGVVEGDLFVAADRVVIAGEVAGNVFAWARELELSGEVGGSLHAVSERLRVDGRVKRCTYTLAGSLVEGPEGRIRGDALGYGREAVFEGSVGGDVLFGADQFDLRGEVGHDVRLPHVGRARILPGARIGGDLEVRVARDADLEVAAEAEIGGKRSIGAPLHGPGGAFWHARPWLAALLQVAAALAFGVVLYALLPGLFRTRVPTVASFLRLLAVGLAVLVGAPLALALLALTLVGLPLAVLGGFLYVTAIYLAWVLAASELGRTLLRRAEGELFGIGRFARILLVGLVVLSLASHVPILGSALRLVVLLAGLGLVAERIRALGRSPIAA